MKGIPEREVLQQWMTSSRLPPDRFLKQAAHGGPFLRLAKSADLQIPRSWIIEGLKHFGSDSENSWELERVLQRWRDIVSNSSTRQTLAGPFCTNCSIRQFSRPATLQNKSCADIALNTHIYGLYLHSPCSLNDQTHTFQAHLNLCQPTYLNRIDSIQYGFLMCDMHIYVCSKPQFQTISYSVLSTDWNYWLSPSS